MNILAMIWRIINPARGATNAVSLEWCNAITSRVLTYKSKIINSGLFNSETFMKTLQTAFFCRFLNFDLFTFVCYRVSVFVFCGIQHSQ
jgi:hypothetical protein